MTTMNSPANFQLQGEIPDPIPDLPKVPANNLAIIKERYRQYVRPGLVERLEAINLDKVYVKAEGDYLFCLDERTKERRVLDLVGGYGGSFFGHNNPELVTEALRFLTQKQPFLSQGSVKWKTAELAERLSQIVKRYTGKDYVVTFTNSGAEALEAAIKHCLLEYRVKLEKREKRIREKISKALVDYGNAANAHPGFEYRAMAEACGLGPAGDFRSLLQAIMHRNEEALRAEPVLLSMQGAFHGKTTGAMSLTANPAFKESFGKPSMQVAFLEAGPKEWDALVDGLEGFLLDAIIEPDGRTRITREAYCRIAGLFVEPIQGEGGVHPVSPEFSEWVARSKHRDYPVIVDEIQSGMGRTGKFLASEHFRLRGDYICLGKSLGGGLAKISALLVDRDFYMPEFSLLHTSTFAEDEYSSSISLRTLDILEDQERKPLFLAERKGAYLIKSILRLKEKYPSVIKEVRGQGLMLGLEFRSQAESNSWILRTLEEQGYFGYLLAGYFLNEFDVRILPTLSSPNTLRIAPSFDIAVADLDYFLTALERACEAIANSDLYALSKYIVSLPKENAAQAKAKPPIEIVRDEADQRAKIGFLGHFIEPADIKLRDPSLRPVPDALMEKFFRKTFPLFQHGQPLERTNIVSVTGAEVNFNFIGLYLTSEVIHNAMKARDFKWVRERIIDSVARAKAEGCTVVGFGGYTSIVTANCQAVPVDGIAMTTGNALTVGMGLEAIVRAVGEKGLRMQDACVGMVGAAGNIGSVYSQLIAETCSRLILIGSDGGDKRLRKLASLLLHQAAGEIRSRDSRDLGGLAAALYRKEDIREALSPERPYESFERDVALPLIDDGRLSDILRISGDIHDLRACNVIVSASNHAGALIYPEHIGDHETVICDIAVPRDTAPSLSEARPRATVIRGGIVKLPRNPAFTVGGVPLEPGQVFACMAETILMGLEGHRTHFSYGEIRKSQVKEILAAAAKHGFALGGLKTGASF